MKGDLKSKKENPEGEEAIDIDFVPLVKRKKKKKIRKNKEKERIKNVMRKKKDVFETDSKKEEFMKWLIVHHPLFKHKLMFNLINHRQEYPI